MNEKALVINANSSEIRVAQLEGGRLAEISIERKSKRGYLGNVYKGKVSRVLPGMQAAFVEIGEEKAAFLFAGDVIDSAELSRRQKLLAEDPAQDFLSLGHGSSPPSPIDDLLKSGQQIMVQVVKDPIGTKGARVTMYLSLPGRYLVLMPHFNHIGISRRIVDEAERQRLRNIIERSKPANFGVIVRTAASDAAEELITRDLQYLIQTWQTIEQNSRKAKPPSLLFQEADAHIKAIRDSYREDVSRIVIDDAEIAADLQRFLDLVVPGASQKIEIYSGIEPVFDRFGVEVDLARALNRKVWLPSGGYLVIDQTEALTAFDVNTGKFVGKHSVRDTILRTNLEAAQEIAWQLRLRNLGGIVVLDFIDMDNLVDQEKVFSAFEEYLKSDKAKINILKISELGLVQMTRKRTSVSLEGALTVECPHCAGHGKVKSRKTVALDLVRDVDRYCFQTKARKLQVRVRPDINALLQAEEKTLINQVCSKHQLKLELLPSRLTEEDLKTPPYELLP